VSAELFVLGAGTILPREGFGASGYALRPRRGAKLTLLDCGPGTLRALAGAGLDWLEIERVLISHFHADHCLDLFALAFARQNPALAALEPIEVLGPRGLREVLERGAHAPARWIKDPRWKIVEVALDADGFGSERRAELELRWAANGHTPESLSWRVELAGGASLAYSADTPPSRAVEQLARDVELFVLECSHTDEHADPRHLTPTSAAAMASAARARRVLLTHFYPDVEPHAARLAVAARFGGPVELARDGLRVEFGA